MADHHQFVVGAPTGETYSPEETGSVIEVGPNFVTIMAGIAYGPVALTVEVLDDAPATIVDVSEWEIVEEATITITKPLYVLTVDGEKLPDFEKLPIKKGLHRFRVSARGRDAHWDLTVTESVEQYLVQVWKTAQPQAMERLHKTDTAWEQDIVAHPKRNWWDPDPSADATRSHSEQIVKQEAIRWAGRPPSEKLRSNYYAVGIANRDRALADAITRARPQKLRRIAIWAAQRAYVKAGIADVEWIRPGLTALNQGEPLPHPFGENQNVELRHAFEADLAIDTTVTGNDQDRHLPGASHVCHFGSSATRFDVGSIPLFGYRGTRRRFGLCRTDCGSAA